MNEKTCTRCEGTFPATLEYFYNNPRGLLGLNSRCKTCCKLQIKEKWERNPEYFNEHAARRRARDPEAENRRTYEITLKSKAKGTACVYTITNKITGKIYVGETIWKHRRWVQHRRELSKGTHESTRFQEDYDKYGIDSFEFSVYKTIEGKDKEKLAFEEEQAMSKLIEEGKSLYNKNRRTNV